MRFFHLAQNLCLRFALCVTVWIALPVSVHADIREWSDKSDVVMIAKLASVTPSDEVVQMGSYRYTTKNFTFVVQKTLKGDGAAHEFVLKTHEIDTHMGGTFSGYYPFFFDFARDQDYLIFAKRNPDSSFSLTDPYDGSESALRLDRVSDQIKAGDSLELNVLRQLIACGAANEPHFWTGYIGDYSDYVQWSPDPSEQDKITHKPDAQRVKALLQSQAIPLVLAATKSENVRVRNLALYEAAKLQSPEIIPQLMAPGVNPQEAKWRLDSLEQFSSPGALPAMIAYFPSSRPEIHTIIREYLRKLQDRRAIPFLLDDLASRDAETRLQAVMALADVQGGMPGNVWNDLEARKDDDAIAYWKAWGKEHAEEVLHLRRSVKIAARK